VSDPPELSARRVLDAVGRHLGIDTGTLRGRDRTARVVGARWAAILLLRDRCRLSYRAIGKLVERHHPTVIHALRNGRAIPAVREQAELVERLLLEESPRTRRAVVDVEEAFRRAREDAGALQANLPRPRAR
jgi:hypothetical protein